jgi:hypothetical protein
VRTFLPYDLVPNGSSGTRIAINHLLELGLTQLKRRSFTPKLNGYPLRNLQKAIGITIAGI